MLDKCQHVSALSYFNQAIIRSNIVAKEEHTEHIMLCKGKGLPQQAWTGPRGSRWVKAPDFLDVLHYEGGRSSAICTGRLYPRRNPW